MVSKEKTDGRGKKDINASYSVAKHFCGCNNLKTPNMFANPLVRKGVENGIIGEDWFPLAEQNMVLEEIRLNNN